MKLLTLAVCALGIFETFAHYTYAVVEYKGVKSELYEYTRKPDNWELWDPLTDIHSEQMTCYNTEINTSSQSTLRIEAGDDLKVWAYNPFGPRGPGTGFFHPAINNVYLARAPNDDVANFDGKGEVWFKIHEDTVRRDENGNPIGWPSWYPTINFTIPQSIPSGQYMLRVENIALMYAYGSISDGYHLQFYVGCGQIEVTNGGNGVPGPLAQFPGYYKGDEPGFHLDHSAYDPPYPDVYIQPGPPLWTGE